MLTEDYIMRMINQAVAVLMAALGLKRAGQLAEAMQMLDQALEGLLGLNASLAKQLDENQLLAMLTFQKKLDVERVLVLAEILREESELYALQGAVTSSQSAAQISLRLYLEAILADEANFNPELIQKIEAVRLKLDPPALPVETRLAMLDYFERLLAKADSFLDSAGLSRSQLQSAFSSLDNPDLH